MSTLGDDVLSRTPPPADLRVFYGSDPNQFGDLRLPSGKGRHAVVMNIHGGYWRAKYDLAHAGHLCAALTKAGVATWNVEYRRVGNPGGGWPGTFEDITNGFRFLSQLQEKYALDLKRFAVMGHSAGGQLALCLAGHQSEHQPGLRGAVSLAGVLDLERAFELHLSNDAVVEFLGGKPDQVPDHYREASPLVLSIAKTKQLVFHGLEDEVVPVSISQQYAKSKLAKKELVKLVELKKTGHFEVIDPQSKSWASIQNGVLGLF